MESVKFERVAMRDVPDPVNKRTQRSVYWEAFEAIISLPSDESFAIKIPVKGQPHANSVVNKLRQWADFYAPQKFILANRASDYKAMWCWWIPIEQKPKRNGKNH
jgi:hypothetical protein